MLMNNPHSHRVAPKGLQEPPFPSSFTHRLQPAVPDQHDELAEQPQSTPRAQHEQTRLGYSHQMQIDAIFTELEDELIAVKDQFLERISRISTCKLLNPSTKSQKIRVQVQKISTLLQSCNQLKEEFLETKMPRQNPRVIEQKKIESFDERLSRRVSEALVDSGEWNMGQLLRKQK